MRKGRRSDVFPTAVLEQALVAQEVIDHRLGSEVATGIRELWHNLARRQIAIRRRDHDGENAAPICGREPICRHMRRGVSGIHLRAGAPPFERAHTKSNESLGGAAPRAGDDGCLDQRSDHDSCLGSVRASASPPISCTFLWFFTEFRETPRGY